MKRLFLIASLAAILCLSAPPAIAKQPNILLVVADDLGYADLGCQGSKDVVTPNIDALAKDGTRFTNAYVSAPVCSPSRAGFLTGRYQTRFGHEFNPALVKYNGQGQGLPLTEKTIADRLKVAGYRTGLVGKWHQGEEEGWLPTNRGFDEFFGFIAFGHSYFESEDGDRGPIYRNRDKVELKGYLTDVLADEACGFIERNQKSPWFLYLAFNAVHTPMEAPPDEVQKFASEKDPARRTYLAMLAKLDAAIGRVLGKVAALNQADDTLVIFFSDNGGPITKFSPNGSRNGVLRGSKGDTWEGGIRVPMILRWPGHVPAGKTYTAPVISLDATATALAAANAGVTRAWKLNGVDLLPHLTGKAKEPPHWFLFWRFGPQMAVRGTDWKLVKPTRSPEVHFVDTPAEPMLFNLRDDPGETTDLAAKFPDRVKLLQAAWDEWNMSNDAPHWPPTLKGKRIELK